MKLIYMLVGTAALTQATKPRQCWFGDCVVKVCRLCKGLDDLYEVLSKSSPALHAMELFR
jgi:hypothetical protein